jgi:hypothetical protein
MQASVEVGETSTTDLVTIEIGLQKNYWNDSGEIKCSFCSIVKRRWTRYRTCWDWCKWHFYFNLQSITLFIWEDGWVLFWQICVCNTFINSGSQTFAPPSFSMWKSGWHIFLV